MATEGVIQCEKAVVCVSVGIRLRHMHRFAVDPDGMASYASGIGWVRRGISMLYDAACRFGHVNPDKYGYSDVTGFMTRWAEVRPAEWFDGWDAGFHDVLADESAFWELGPLASHGPVDESASSIELGWVPSESCHRLCLSVGLYDVMAVFEESKIVEELFGLDEESYSAVRTFIAEHPMLDGTGYSDMQRAIMGLADPMAAQKVLDQCYEPLPPGDVYRCPKCGWTLTRLRGSGGWRCQGRHCCDSVPQVVRTARDEGWLSRLVYGAMKWIAAPGRLELEIREKCRDHGCDVVMYPGKDAYDLDVVFPDGTRWKVDAKAVEDWRVLCRILDKKGVMRKDAAHARAYYVIPDGDAADRRVYCTRVNGAIPANACASCVTVSEFERLMVAKMGVD